MKPAQILPTWARRVNPYLIHGFHHYLRSGRTRRPVAVNLIDGDLTFVADFLNRLTCGPASTPGLSRAGEASDASSETSP